jgi:unsaturated chondroitin disaccharide hydrolase
MWHILSGASYRITGSEASCVRNLYAASVLASRYDVEGDYIIAWNGGNEAFSIIDCLMNLPLLYWASREIGDERFKKLAVRHMNMALRDHIREDGSTNHVVVHDREKPGVIEVRMGQGYSPTSCWSRGLAWAVYGSVLSYIHTGKAEYLQAAKKTADYFIHHCKQTDYRPLLDFLAPPEPVYYDSTAGVCAACGILELAKYVSEEESSTSIFDIPLTSQLTPIPDTNRPVINYTPNTNTGPVTTQQQTEATTEEQTTKKPKPTKPETTMDSFEF